MKNNGSLVISLDFEMMWGNIETWDVTSYGNSNIANVPKVIDRMLALFTKYNVHATFATVGLIMHPDKEEALRHIPRITPSYTCPVLSPYYNKYINNIKDADSNLYFAEDLVSKIQRHEGMEVGSHTYCHYYCWEEGQTTEEFEEDIKSAVEVAKSKGIELKSIVFPRNQVSAEHLRVCAKYGITSYRGNALKYFNEPKSAYEKIKNRIWRLLDAYINIGGMSTFPYKEIDATERPINIRASRFLRPYSKKMSILDCIRLRRMKKELLHAAKNGEIYHIWWHPHNWGSDIEHNIRFLEKFLQCFAMCREEYNMQSYNMNEIYQQLINK